MAKYESLTKFIPLLGAEEYGHWVIDRTSAGTKEDLITMPYVLYGEVAMGLSTAIYDFIRSPAGAESHDYSSVLKANGMSWSARDIRGADLSNLDGVCVVSMMLAILRGDRFCDGAYLAALESGWFKNCLERLAELDAME